MESLQVPFYRRKEDAAAGAEVKSRLVPAARVVARVEHLGGMDGAGDIAGAQGVRRDMLSRTVEWRDFVMGADGHRRPVAVSMVGWLFVAVGCGSCVRAGWRYLGASSGPAPSGQPLLELALVVALGAAAAIGGAGVLRGRAWGRWLLVLWMATHVAISLLHTTSEVLAHAAMLVVLVLVLWTRTVSAWFSDIGGNPPRSATGAGTTA